LPRKKTGEQKEEEPGLPRKKKGEQEEEPGLSHKIQKIGFHQMKK
jgi:hypothetical protein